MKITSVRPIKIISILILSTMLAACGGDDSDAAAGTPPAVKPDVKPPVTTIPATPIGPGAPVKPEIIPPTVILPIEPPVYVPPEIIFPLPKPEIVPPTVILPAPEQRKLIQELRFSDGATELKKENFGLDNWNPKALATKNDILYIGNDSGTANILRYDLNNKAVLPTIQPEKLFGIGQSWNRLTDISIYQYLSVSIRIVYIAPLCHPIGWILSI